MWQELRLLKHKADPPSVWRNAKSAGGIEKRMIAELNIAGIHPLQARNDPQDGRFPRSGGTEQRRYPLSRLEDGIKREAGPRKARRKAHHAASPPRPIVRRARISEAMSAPSAMTMDTSDKRKAPASPPGTCVRA